MTKPNKTKTSKTKASTPSPAKLEKIKSLSDIAKNRVAFTESGCGMKLAKNTPIDEFLIIFDHTIAQKERVGFYIGDLIIQGRSMYGDGVYEDAMASSGRALSTLTVYESVARSIPEQFRSAHLSFKHYKEIQHVADPEKLTTLVRIAEHADSGKPEPLTVREFKVHVEKLAPKPKRKGGAGRPPSDPNRKKASNRTPKGWCSISPTFTEEALLEEISEKSEQLEAAIKYLVEDSGKSPVDYLKSLGSKWKSGILSALKPIAEIYAELAPTANWGE